MGPGGIVKGSYDAPSLSADQRQWLFEQFGHQGQAPSGYGGEHVSGDYGTNYVKTGSGYGADQQAITNAITARQKAEMDQRFAQGKSDITDFLGRYNAAVPTIINNASAKYDVPGLANITNALNSRIQDLKFNLSGSGAGGYASAGQVDKALNTNYLPQYSLATENLQRGAALANQEAQMALTPYQTEGQLLNDRLAREITGYTAEQQRELEGYLTTLSTGVELTKAQMDQAYRLAALEQEKVLKEQELAAQKEYQANQLKSLNKYGLYNPATGEIIGGGGTATGTNSFNVFNSLPTAPSYFTPAK